MARRKPKKRWYVQGRRMPARLTLKYFINQARKDKTWANKALKDKAWMSRASEWSKQTARKYATTPVKQMARERLDYWKMRKPYEYM